MIISLIGVHALAHAQHAISLNFESSKGKYEFNLN